MALVESKKLWNALGLGADSLCDLRLVSSPPGTAGIPSLQRGHGGAEPSDSQGPAQPCPLIAGLPPSLGGWAFFSQGLMLSWEVALTV